MLGWISLPILYGAHVNVQPFLEVPIPTTITEKGDSKQQQYKITTQK
jgi:hypothetical protein